MNAERRHIVVMAGGTGGHVFPALSVAHDLQRQNVAISWMGTRRGLEAEQVPKNGFPIYYVDVEGLRGSGVGRLLKAPWLLSRALVQAMKVLRQLEPDAVLGMGGFVSGPGGLGARLLGIPLVIHEQNSVPGTTNRILARLARRVMVAFPGTLPKGEWCGNPVRGGICQLPPPRQRAATREVRDQPHLLVLGGSLGAKTINEMMPRSIARIPGPWRPVIRHQCGRSHVESTEKGYRQARVTARVEPFIEDMAQAYAWADLVVCRAGALTISELTCAGVAALLIPYPHAIDDHQTHNAEWLVDAGAAEMVADRELEPERLAMDLHRLLEDKENLIVRGEKARALARPEAVERVAEACLEVCNA